ncbi:MAG: M20 metallopeptidase family protein [Atopobiaceae bacterium]|jgi:amidohydrolase
MNVKEAVSAVMPDVVSWRRHLHENPEVGFELTNTLDFVAQRLEEMGVEHEVHRDKSYIVGWINKDASGKTVALRADMDALPVEEDTGLTFSSKVPGKMHACGHDAHTAMLLGTAKVLSEHKDELKGRVKLIFQPAEELGTGAHKVCEDGVLKDVDEIVGLHVGNISEEAKPGQLVFSLGPMMATMDKFSLKVVGKGAHGSTPHASVDPVMVAAEIITSLQSIISREKDPRNPAVISVGKVRGGSAFNIIPDTVEMEGTTRTLTNEDRDFIEKRIGEVAEGVAHALRADIVYEFFRQPPPVINDEAVAKRLVAVGQDLYPDDTLMMSRPVMGGEDFAWYLQEVPGAFFLLCNPLEVQGALWPQHSCHFAINEDVLNRGIEVMSEFVSRELA